MSKDSVSFPEVLDYNAQDASKLFFGSEVSKALIVPTYHTSCEITFHDNKNNKDFHFTPQEDITAFELTKVFKLWVHCSAGFYLIDVSTYLRENGIERHFTEK
jgi:hypothetical protein